MTERFRVVAYGGFEGVTFPDLIVRYSNGYEYPLTVHQGDYVPVELIHPVDVHKSRLVGSLFKHIAAGNVVVERPETPKPFVPPVHQVVEPLQFQAEIASALPTEIVKEPIETVEPIVVPPPPPLNVASVSTLEQYHALAFNQRLTLIKQSENMDLLKQIYDATDVIQFRENIKRRLKGK